jgi:hypothetical protein
MMPKSRVTEEQAHSDRPAAWHLRKLVVPSRPLLVLHVEKDLVGVSLREWAPCTSERW